MYDHHSLQYDEEDEEREGEPGAYYSHRRECVVPNPSNVVRTRPEFNARKASARCRAIEGYVSFASVEGLGEPPEGPISPVDGEDGERDCGKKGKVMGLWKLDWRKLWVGEERA